jgi:hypothetical protein
MADSIVAVESLDANGVSITQDFSRRSRQVLACAGMTAEESARRLVVSG